MCDRSPTHAEARATLVAALADAIAATPEPPRPPDQVALAEALVARLVEHGPSSWSPRVQATTLGNRTFARVYLGRGDASFLYLAEDGRWRMAAGLPVWWRQEVKRVMGEDLDDQKRGNGYQVAKRRRERDG